MPQIFDKIGREKIQENLFLAGFELIKTQGYKKTSVADISRKVGIATGTFYNFFPSKDEYIYQLVVYNRTIVKERFQSLISDGKIDKETFRQFLIENYFADNNVFDYLNEKEIGILSTKWSDEKWKSESNDEKTTNWILKNLEGVRPQCEWKVVANLSKSIALIRFGKVRLYQEEYDKTLGIYIEAMLRYIFEEGVNE
ncbi:MAG: TetR/AcrR family transcriptional regulator [Eubacteriales bacterium]